MSQNKELNNWHRMFIVIGIMAVGGLILQFLLPVVLRWVIPDGEDGLQILILIATIIDIGWPFVLAAMLAGLFFWLGANKKKNDEDIS